MFPILVKLTQEEVFKAKKEILSDGVLIGVYLIR
jgi:hypothetical protein